MKIAIAFLLLVHTVYTAKPLTRQLCNSAVNYVRSVHADKSQVANMNELLYNKNLEKRIYEQLAHTNGCPDPSMVSDDGFHVHLNVRADDQDMLLRLSSGAESSMMACVQTRCLETGEEVVSVITDSSDTYPINGKPGTQCSAGFVNSEGLCARRQYARKGKIWKDAIDCFPGRPTDQKDWWKKPDSEVDKLLILFGK